MRASLEAVTYVLRIHPGPHDPANPKPPYIAAATVTVGDDTATIRGFAMEGFDKAAWRAVMGALATVGITDVVYTRRVPGKRPRLMRVKVPPVNKG
jgi:hypothetical protein